MSCKSAVKVYDISKGTLSSEHYFVEKAKRSYQKLESYLANNKWDGIETGQIHGEFHDVQGEILKWCGNRDFAFFFIDPKGWKNAIEIPTLAPLLRRPNSEYLINFMYDFLVRTHTQKEFQSDMQSIFGEVPDTSGMSPKQREDYLITRYREGLKSIQPGGSGRLRSAYVSILDPVKERTKYHLVYITRHPLGIVKFMDASEKTDIVQKRVRAETKQQRRIEKTGQEELFPADIDTGLLDDTVELEVVKAYWLNKLAELPRPFGNEDLADMLEETNWFETNLQQAFGELLSEGRVNNLDAKKKRSKKPVHFNKNERLQRL